MKIHEFIQICHSYLGDGENKTEFMQEFFRSITLDSDDKTNFICPFTSKEEAKKAQMVYSGKRDLTKNDAIFLKGHFREDLLMNKIEELPESVLQSLVDDLKKYDIDSNIHIVSESMCQLFRDIINYRINFFSKDDITEIKRKKNDKSERAHEKNDITSPNILNFEEELIKISSNDIDIARNFCIDHEEEKELFPLCQVAFNLNPRHNYIRKMYTEYNRLSEDVRKAIMFMNEIPIYNFDSEWQYCLLADFTQDIEKYKLSDRDMFYDGGKYFHNASKYPNYVIDGPDPFIFPATPNFRPKGPIGNLRNYIDEYIYYLGNEEAMKYVGEPPLTWMIYNLDLLECPEDDMMFWMNLFVYSACHVIARYENNPSRQYNSFFVPSLYELETLEDLYFAALLSLFETYRC